MNRLHVSLIGGVGLVVLGVALAVSPALEYWRNRQIPHTATSPFLVVASAVPSFPVQKTYIRGEPTRIRVPRLGIDLTIREGVYDRATKSWTLSSDAAHHALNTPPPNNRDGNTFIYAHNRPGLFQALNQIRSGDKVIVMTANGHRFTYAFRTAYETTPTDSAPFQYTGAPILTLQTCSGLWYQNRQLFTFDLTEAV
jgi:LPXTG-site transpeptidase (sortase) family protein